MNLDNQQAIHNALDNLPQLHKDGLNLLATTISEGRPTEALEHVLALLSMCLLETNELKGKLKNK